MAEGVVVMGFVRVSEPELVKCSYTLIAESSMEVECNRDNRSGLVVKKSTFNVL